MNPYMEDLTDRQTEFALLLVRGLTPEKIAEKLGIAVTTAKTHRRDVYRKLEVHNLGQLVQRMCTIKPKKEFVTDAD